MGYIKFNSVTIWSDEGDTPNVGLLAEKDINGRVHAIEPLGDRWQNLYRDSMTENKQYTIVVILAPSYHMTLEELMTTWKGNHAAMGGQLVLERRTELGGVFQLDCVAATPQFGDISNGRVEVTQTYTAANPWWRAATETDSAGTFGGGIIACDNIGDVETWLRIEMHGLATTPKIELPGEWEIEIYLDLTHIDDLLLMDTKTPATAWYTPNGGATTRAYGYRSAASSFRKAKIPPGASNLSPTSFAGGGLLTVYWYPRYEALR